MDVPVRPSRHDYPSYLNDSKNLARRATTLPPSGKSAKRFPLLPNAYLRGIAVSDEATGLTDPNGGTVQTRRIPLNGRHGSDPPLAQLDEHNLEAEMAGHVEQHKAQMAKLLQGVAGIGRVAAATLIAELLELGRLNRRQTCALVGVAPYANVSGARRGRRRIIVGRVELHRALYMATLAAMRYNPAIRMFYERLVAAGKLKKVALGACVRKLDTHVNALTRNRLNAQDHPATA